MNLKTSVSLALVIGIAAVALLFVLHVKKTSRAPASLRPSSRTIPPDEIDKYHLKTLPVPTDIRAHLLDEEFTIIRRWQDIPSNCTEVFETSFKRTSGIRAKPGEISFANPGEPFQASDNIVDLSLPFRRLHFVGIGVGNCFIYYHRGGGQPNAHCLAIMNFATRRTVFVGESGEAAADLSQLRRMLREGQSEDINWLAVC